MPRAKGLGRVIPVVGVLDHGRARYAEFPRYLPVAQALAVELPDTPSDTHRCRHFLSSREPSVWLTGTRESIKEPDDAGVPIPPAPSPPTPSKLNAQGVQEQVPTVNTFIRSHTALAGSSVPLHRTPAYRAFLRFAGWRSHTIQPPTGSASFSTRGKDMPTRPLVQGQTSIISTTKVPIGQHRGIQATKTT